MDAAINDREEKERGKGKGERGKGKGERERKGKCVCQEAGVVGNALSTQTLLQDAYP